MIKKNKKNIKFIKKKKEKELVKWIIILWDNRAVWKNLIGILKLNTNENNKM